MSPILGILDSAKTGRLGNYYSIATTTVGAGGTSSITFSSIPSTYTHLQLRAIGRLAASDTPRFRVGAGSVDTGANYTRHLLYGDGATPTSAAGTGATSFGFSNWPINATTANVFGTAIIDILDYTNTNKYKTVRTLSGYDANGSGYSMFYSGLWLSTSAIDTITFTSDSSTNYVQYTQFALYGVK